MYTNSRINKVMLAAKVSKEPRLHNHNQERRLCFNLVTKEVIYWAKGDTDHEDIHQICVEETNSALKRLNLKKSIGFCAKTASNQRFCLRRNYKAL